MEFLPSGAVLLTFTLACAVLIITPGPDMTLFLSKTVGEGRASGLAAYAGATTGLLVHTLVAAVGLSALLAASAEAFMVVKVVGALYLLWLAIDAVRNGSALSVEAGDDPSAVRRSVVRQSYLKGLAINLLNPKIVLFFVTFLPQFVVPTDPFAAQKLAFLGLYLIVLALPCCVAMIFAADRIAALLRRSPRITRVVDWLFASVFAGFAVALLTERARA